MSLKVGNNFSYQGKKPNFARDQFETLLEMKSFPVTSIDEGHISTCLEDGKKYIFSLNNQEDSVTGYWRRVVDTELDGSSENPVQNKVIVAKINEVSTQLDQRITTQGQTLTQSINELQTDTANGLRHLQEDYTEKISEVKDFTSNALVETENSLTSTHNRDISDIRRDVNQSLQELSNGLNLTINTFKNSTNTKLDELESVDGIVAHSISNLKNEINEISEITASAINEISTTISNVSLNNIDIESIENHLEDTSNPHSVTKSQVGLDQVTNNAQVKRSEMGVANGVATLDSHGIIPSTQSWREILTYTAQNQFPATGEAGRFYLDSSNYVLYTWDENEEDYVPLRPIFGNTSTTSFSGAAGKVLREDLTAHILNTSNPHNVSLNDLGVPNFEKSLSLSISNLKDNLNNSNEAISESINELRGRSDSVKRLVIETRDYISGIDERLTLLENYLKQIYYIS